MRYISSQSNNDGSYTLDVTFALGTDVNMAQLLVLNRVAIAEPTLPDVVRAIGVTVKKRSSDILLGVSLYCEDIPETGRLYHDQLSPSNYAAIQFKDALARVEGVGDVTIFGQQDYSMRVWLDSDKLEARNLTLRASIRHADASSGMSLALLWPDGPNDAASCSYLKGCHPWPVNGYMPEN